MKHSRINVSRLYVLQVWFARFFVSLLKANVPISVLYTEAAVTLGSALVCIQCSKTCPYFENLPSKVCTTFVHDLIYPPLVPSELTSIRNANTLNAAHA